MKLNKYIDHTLLKPDATKKEIEILCKEAIEYDFATVCINPCFVSLASSILKKTNIGITTVVGFPLGSNTINTKVLELKEALNNGASEIDFVINISAVKDKDWIYVLNEFKEIKNNANSNIVKVILETCLLTKEEIIKCCELACEAKIDYVKTSTGFSKAGATFENVKLMKDIVSSRALVKAAGGIRSFDDAIKMIENGASRLGTSGGINIIKGETNNTSY
ncbi:deoxyribose-phosphate aldolase [Spiroplasma tabanidicola]|uniref:Deoxyribose-phosphate aldolase n=1 Tax=Spiroplasma tabanidicola TaxID=324079 RepID=A0A6I6CCP5_9MOLU|nr:deoxyribose-phosphate aldolase [Spiroplasma tabanidicola]QGS51912.1 deoxyribose-phosphate aldolase [Spiroplasma tabanidicola]